MRDLKIQLSKQLKAVHPRVYFENAPDDAIYPYIVYSFGSSYTNRANEIYALDIDVWDKNQSSRAVDELLSKINKALNMTSYIDDKIQYSLYYDRKLDTGSDDKTLKRKTIVFELRYAERS